MRPKSNPEDAEKSISTDHSHLFPDPVESTGCQAENDALLLCFDRTKDWRACVKEMRAFRLCFERYQEESEARVLEAIRMGIERGARAAEEAVPMPSAEEIQARVAEMRQKQELNTDQ
jgi:hypothetical protein